VNIKRGLKHSHGDHKLVAVVFLHEGRSLEVILRRN